MAKGTIKRIFEEKGYGFIQPEAGKDDVWFHASKLRDGVTLAELQVGIQVEYEATRTERGFQATSVKVTGAQPKPPRQARQTTAYRFLNPYNFVRFLSLAEQPGVAPSQSTTTIGAALLAAGWKGGASESTQPETPLLGRCAPPPHDRYVALSGKIVCNLEAVTPLFVSDSHGVQLRGEHRSYEFFKIDDEHSLPATSLRGMVRSVFEAATNSCVAWLNDARLSYHLDAADATKLVPAMVEIKGNNMSLKLLPGTTALKYGERPNGPQYAAWILRYLPPLRRSQNIPGTTPYGNRKIVNLNGYTHKSLCWASLKLIEHPRRRFQFWNVERLAETRAGLPDNVLGQELVAQGYLCITKRNIENKHDERFFFFGGGLDNAPIIRLNDDEAKSIRRGYQDLIRDYQMRHHDKVNRPSPQDNSDSKKVELSRFIVDEKEADLRDGDLVYAFLDGRGKAEFIVPVSVPRVAYKRLIAELLPDAELAACQNHQSLCAACRVFGWVHQNPNGDTEAVAYAGRVRFSHGILKHSAGTLSPFPLAILSSPKPTTTRFYLKPKNGNAPEKWMGDNAKAGYNGDNVLRGRKFYRHHGAAQELEYRRAGDRCDDQNRTVRDTLKPGARFEFTVHFENLAPIELGALLWSLEMDGKCVHRLGFAKPLGFGSVKLAVKDVVILDPDKRYLSLDNAEWPLLEDWQNKYVEEFKRAMAGRYGANDFEELGNIQDLRALLVETMPKFPVHYPRTSRLPDPEGRNFEWFMGNNRYLGYPLGSADKDHGLPLIARDGAEEN